MCACHSLTIVKATVFPVVMYGCESWTIKQAKGRRIDAFELWCWRRLLRVPWTARRSNQSILKEISPEYTLEGLTLKLKLQYFVHLMWRADSLETTLMLGKFEGGRRRGQQRMRWLDGITDLMDWLWASSGSWWWTGKPGVLQFRACKESDMTEPLNWCHSLWTPAWFPYMAQWKMCPNGVQACQEGASSIILQEAGLKIWCDIPLSISVLCQWMRGKPYEPISQDIMPWDCGLSIFSSTWELFHLCIPNIGFPEKIQFRGKKSLLLKMIVNYNSMIRSPDPGYLWVLDAKALSRPGTECLTILLAGKVKCVSEACDLWMNMPGKNVGLINLTSYWRFYQGGQNCQREPRTN